ncbi:hypothetical protein ACF1AE_21660 [Streptomyces sp. NPDC014986]|uniref:hypothetical protein n=1 Tax=Streptomyces sp. NPDC014986 TaxID=3364934 RepID=UPI0036F7FA9A
MRTDRIDRVLAEGTGHLPRRIRLADDTVLSVQAGPGAWCRPKPRLYGMGNVPADYPGPYSHLEVYLLTLVPVPESWKQYGDAHEDGHLRHFDAVPEDLVRSLVAEHGGEHAERNLEDDALKALSEAFFPAR